MKLRFKIDEIIENIRVNNNTSVLRHLINKIIKDLPRADEVHKAIKLLESFHILQLRKDGMTPYLAHLYKVSLIYIYITILYYHEQQFNKKLESFNSDEVLIALLHDILEDTEISQKFLQNNFGVTVANGVYILSKKINGIRIINNVQYYISLQQQSAPLRWIKSVDRLTNLDTYMREKNIAKRQLYLKETKQYILQLSNDNPYLQRKIIGAYNSLCSTFNFRPGRSETYQSLTRAFEEIDGYKTRPVIQ
jgi:(p)ppGpp synthase/HD superfamily hydrolase